VNIRGVYSTNEVCTDTTIGEVSLPSLILLVGQLKYGDRLSKAAGFPLPLWVVTRVCPAVAVLSPASRSRSRSDELFWLTISYCLTVQCAEGRHLVVVCIYYFPQPVAISSAGGDKASAEGSDHDDDKVISRAFASLWDLYQRYILRKPWFG